MKRENVLHNLAANQEELKRFGAKSLAIFGSVARDEAHSKSDSDALVEFDSPATFDRYMNLKFFWRTCLANLVTHKTLLPYRHRHFTQTLQRSLCARAQFKPMPQFMES